MLNGVTQLIMMKPDVMSGFDTIKVCTHYMYRGKQINYMPFDIVHNEATPVYIEMKGWKQTLDSITDEELLPVELMDYISYIEQETNLPITIVSVGPDRKQTLKRSAVLK